MQQLEVFLRQSQAIINLWSLIYYQFFNLRSTSNVQECIAKLLCTLIVSEVIGNKVLTLNALMDSSSWANTINLGLPIVYIYTLRDVSYNARWFWTTIRYGPMTTAYLCWTTGNGF